MRKPVGVRLARSEDAFEIQRVYQLDRHNPCDDHIFAQARDITAHLLSPDSIWLVLLEGGRAEGFVWILVDRRQQLAKINQAFVNPALPGGREVAIEALVAQALDHLRTFESSIEVLYTNMRPLAYRQDLIRHLGFRTLGLFPNGQEVDESQVNSLAAFYLSDVLQKKRSSQITLHPQVAELYEIVRQECGLDSLPVVEESSDFSYDLPEEVEDPDLEIITAPLFVSHRFERLQVRRSLAVNFYPFHEPNTLVTNPSQTIEVFVKIFPVAKIATIIGERFDANIDPVSLYARIARMLRSRGVSYIEVINDAGDFRGTDAIIKAGYLPCAYFPALKSQGDSRRDYVVFARSFENICYPSLEKVDPIYVKYLRHFHRIEARAYHRLFE